MVVIVQIIVKTMQTLFSLIWVTLGDIVMQVVLFQQAANVCCWWTCFNAEKWCEIQKLEAMVEFVGDIKLLLRSINHIACLNVCLEESVNRKAIGRPRFSSEFCALFNSWPDIICFD